MYSTNDRSTLTNPDKQFSLFYMFIFTVPHQHSPAASRLFHLISPQIPQIWIYFFPASNNIPSSWTLLNASVCHIMYVCSSMKFRYIHMHETQHACVKYMILIWMEFYFIFLIFLV